MVKVDSTLERMQQAEITDLRMHDGSRHFLSLPESRESKRLLRHVFGLGFALPYFYLSTAVECWIDFWFRGHRFTINNQFGEYWFFVKNPACPRAILEEVALHFSRFLSTE
jgi:hypothetical protein